MNKLAAATLLLGGLSLTAQADPIPISGFLQEQPVFRVIQQNAFGEWGQTIWLDQFGEVGHGELWIQPGSIVKYPSGRTEIEAESIYPLSDRAKSLGWTKEYNPYTILPETLWLTMGGVFTGWLDGNRLELSQNGESITLVLNQAPILPESLLMVEQKGLQIFSLTENSFTLGFQGFKFAEGQFSAIPEPSSFILLGIGLAFLFLDLWILHTKPSEKRQKFGLRGLRGFPKRSSGLFF